MITWYSDSTFGAFGARYSGSVAANTSTSFLTAAYVPSRGSPRSYRGQNYCHRTVRKIKVRIFQRFFFLFELKNVDVKFRQRRAIHSRRNWIRARES